MSCRALETEEPKQQEQGGSSSGSGKKEPVDWGIVGPVFLFSALGGALFGYDIGATSGALPSLTSPELSGTDWYNLSAFQSGTVVSSSLLGALAGSGGAFAFGDRLGRRGELLLAAVLYGAGAVTAWGAPNYETLVLGRVLYGLAIGFGMHAAPAYISETVPSSVRGLLISLKEALICVGVLSGYSLGYLTAEQVGGWRTIFGAALFPAIALGAGMLWLMESPRWLLLKPGRREQAVTALTRARGRYGTNPAAIEREISDIEASVSSQQGSGGLQALFGGRNLRPLLIGSSLMLFQQITGQPSVLYYASNILQDAGFAAGKDAEGVSVLLGGFKLIMTGVTVVLVDRAGRRPLLLGGVAAMAAALAGLATQKAAGLPPTVAAAALLLYVGAYQISFGPISWLIVGEIFPLSVRGQATAVATLVNFGSNFGVSLVLPSVQDGLGAGGAYALFGVVSVLALASIYWTVPETKGKSLEEIEKMLDRGEMQ
jgi:sugar porter (SP) family MFS transporter